MERENPPPCGEAAESPYITIDLLKTYEEVNRYESF